MDDWRSCHPCVHRWPCKDRFCMSEQVFRNDVARCRASQSTGSSHEVNNVEKYARERWRSYNPSSVDQESRCARIHNRNCRRVAGTPICEERKIDRLDRGARSAYKRDVCLSSRLFAGATEVSTRTSDSDRLISLKDPTCGIEWRLLNVPNWRSTARWWWWRCPLCSSRWPFRSRFHLSVRY